MKLGFALPQTGPSGPEAITLVAKRAEELGYESLWVTWQADLLPARE